VLPFFETWLEVGSLHLGKKSAYGSFAAKTHKRVSLLSHGYHRIKRAAEETDGAGAQSRDVAWAGFPCADELSPPMANSRLPKGIIQPKNGLFRSGGKHRPTQTATNWGNVCPGHGIQSITWLERNGNNREKRRPYRGKTSIRSARSARQRFTDAKKIKPSTSLQLILARNPRNRPRNRAPGPRAGDSDAEENRMRWRNNSLDIHESSIAGKYTSVDQLTRTCQYRDKRRGRRHARSGSDENLLNGSRGGRGGEGN